VGTLFYVVGASGAGKDSLMTYARARLGGRAPVFFAHRYITRPAEAGGENHVALNKAEFAQMKALGLFALSWESHGFCYGLGREIELWLDAGANVVMNGSRAFLPVAEQRFPGLAVVLIEVSAAVLRARLEARGRESPEEIAARLARAAEFTVIHPSLVTIRNNGSLAEAGDQLVAVLRETRPAPAVPASAAGLDQSGDNVVAGGFAGRPLVDSGAA
jgi:ribose 1,5-bisphosphokinase